MNKTNCGNCNWHDEIQQGKTYCLVDNQWYDLSYSCKTFIGYSQLNREARSRRASEIRQRLETEDKELRDEQEAESRAQKDREFAEKMAQKDREHTEEIARINRKHAEEIARINREHDEKLQQKGMAFERRQRRTSFWRQVVLAVFSASLGIAGTLIVQALTK